MDDDESRQIRCQVVLSQWIVSGLNRIKDLDDPSLDWLIELYFNIDMVGKHGQMFTRRT